MNIKILENKKILWLVQVLIFFAVNTLFILKYVARTSVHPLIALGFYAVFIFVVYLFLQKFLNKMSVKVFKVLFWTLLILMIVAISLVLVKVDPYSIRVDRWSALSFFWDSVFQGKYPYATHTHVSVTNFPSPFPFWHLISLPFYLMGDVGIGIIAFLVLVSLTVKYYFQSFKHAFIFLLILALSPGYWWEVFARSDSLSNAFFVFSIILWALKTNKSVLNNFAGAMLVAGLIAATRFTALLPVALFIFPSFLQLTLKKKILFLIGAFLVAFIAFSPFVFWDTETWIFFKRNPFMSQTKNGSFPVFLVMIVLGVLLSLTWKKRFQYFFVTSLFVFVFILSTQIVIYYQGNVGTFFEGSMVDLSYFNLALPYCLVNFAFYFDENQHNKQLH